MHKDRSVRVDGLDICYRDSGGDGMPMLALHGTFGRGAAFDGLTENMADRVRLIAPDQRGHGYSSRAEHYGCDEFVDDAAALLYRLDLGPAVVLGHSRGGITAYQLAARYPDLVAALVIEDMGPVMRRPEIANPVLPVHGWPASAPTKDQLAERICARGVSDAAYFMQSAVSGPDGCRLLFDWEDMMQVQLSGVGDWWGDWLGSDCPALVLRGIDSVMLPAPLAETMVAARRGASLVVVAGAGHWIHDDAPLAMAAAIAAFLDRVRGADHPGCLGR